MSTNQTIESPNFEKIQKEAGQFTSDAINLLWAALNDTRKTSRMGIRQATEVLEPKVIYYSAAASVDNFDLQGSSILDFTGAVAQNFTGMRAPDPGIARVVFVHVSGAGTITLKNLATSSTGNQLATNTGADKTLTQGQGAVFAYLASRWRQIV